MKDYYKLKDLGYYAGNRELLNENHLTIYCSRKIPLSIYNQSLSLLTNMSKNGFTLAGGWHSPVERKVLKRIVKIEDSKVIYFIAKGIKDFNLFNYLTPLWEKNRILIISPLKELKQIEKKSVQKRDELIKKLSDFFLFLYIDSLGNLQNHYNSLSDKNKELFILNNPTNSPFFNEGIKRIDELNYVEVLNDRQ